MVDVKKLWIVALLVVFVMSCSVFAQEAKFQQTDDEDGLVCMEAENYSSFKESSTVSYWEAVDTPANFSGTGGMQAFPAEFTEHKDLSNAESEAPVLEYTVNFLADDPVYVWVRASHLDGYDDSMWFGMDDLIYGENPISFTTDEQSIADEWHWLSFLMNDETAIMELESTGFHVFQLFMREPLFKVDKVVLSKNPNFFPEGVGPAETLAGGSAVADRDAVMPNMLELGQNYPNPFNPETTINYTLAKNSFVNCTIYNNKGQEVANLVNENQVSGTHQVTWVANGMESGIYFLELKAGEYSETRKLVLQK